MHSRRTLRRRRGSRAGVRRWCLIAAATCVPVLVIGYAVAAAHGGRAVDTANVTAQGTWPGDGGGTAGGWGRGGYTMMPGPAGQASAGSGAASQAAQGSVANANAMTSENWSGYATAGSPGTFTNVSASWTQPAVTCTGTDTFASFWVGLDGNGTSTVEQTGTEADCDAAARYQGWFEMFPNAPVFYYNPVEPGDAMSASVVANGGGLFTLTLTDSTRHWTQSISQMSDTAQLGSAEVIAEAPSTDDTVLPLSNFGAVTFSDATINNAPIGNENPSALTMVSAEGITEATPSALTGGNAFTVAFGGGTPTAPSPTTTATPTPTPTPTPTGTGTGTGTPTATPTPTPTLGSGSTPG